MFHTTKGKRTRKVENTDKIINTTIAGLATDPKVFEEVKETAIKTLRIIEFKEAHPSLPLIIVMMGGTGTGKSTVFNGLIEHEISMTSVERPATGGGIFYCHEEHIPPLKEMIKPWWNNILLLESGNISQPLSGEAGKITVVLHQDPDGWFIAIDSPDLDSLVEENEKAALDFYLLADLIVFISSMEKYADNRPLSQLKQARLDEREVVFVLNKITPDVQSEEIHAQINNWGLTEEKGTFTLRRIQPVSVEGISSELGPFKKYIQDTIEKDSKKVRKKEISAARKRLTFLQERLQKMISLEREAYDNHVLTLENTFLSVWSQLHNNLSMPKDPALKKVLKSHIKELYQKYDILAPPRRLISSVFKIPLRLMGILPPLEDKIGQDIKTLHHKTDMAPIVSALTEYQLRVAREIKEGPFKRALYEKKPEMDQDEVKELFQTSLKEVEVWLDERFKEMKRGMPAHKKAGMYSLSLAWGVVIVGIESVTMGGLSILEMAIDAALAPFVTGGTLEIFVLNEMKAIARGLNERYTKVVRTVLTAQNDRYLKILKDLQPR
ncbi:MAG: hypothetical protein SWO11_04765 [Thermodesulfobacteriota bacterium]|nr:hypothetical protein [Thermodesulfobacteriota bacterium]